MKHRKKMKCFISILVAMTLTLVPVEAMAVSGQGSPSPAQTEDTPAPSGAQTEPADILGTPGEPPAQTEPADASPVPGELPAQTKPTDASPAPSGTSSPSPAETIRLFDALTAEIASQSHAVGTLASQAELTLPGTLLATATNGNSCPIDGVIWACKSGFDPAAVGEYAFTPTLPDGYALEAGVTLPTIIVKITPHDINVMALGSGLQSNSFEPDTPFDEIKVAIEGAESGETFYFAAGTFTFEDTITITKDITIEGAGQSQTDINSADGFRHFTIEQGNVTLSGMTLTGPGSDGGTADTVNGGVRSSGAELTLADMTVTGCNNSGSGGAVASAGNITITGSAFENNTAVVYGGAVFASGNVTITGSAFENNTAAMHGGGVASSGNVTITGSTITGNKAAAERAAGGGVFANGEVTVQNSTISDNIADAYGGGGGGVASNGNVTITGSAITGNKTTADYSGGGGVFANGEATVQNSTISGNTAGAYGGGGVYSNSKITITDSTIADNVSGFMGGGGLSSLGGNVTITNSTITGNKTGGNGGGVFASVEGTTTTITNSTITDNVSDNTGCAMYVAAAEIINCTITNNGTEGSRTCGGVEAYQELTIKGSIIAGNHGSGDVKVVMGSDPWPTGAPSESNQYNIIGYSSGYEEKDIFGEAGPVLANNGGPTKTILLSPDSTAAGKIPKSVGWLPDKDQRGAVRNDMSAIGAVETDSYSLTVTLTDDSGGNGTLRNAILAANRKNNAEITFDPLVFDTAQTITLASALPEITAPVTITGPGADKVTIRSKDGTRHFTIADGVDVTMSGMTLQGPGAGGGMTAAVNGGIESGTGMLTLKNIVVTDCRNNLGNGGGVYADKATIANSAIIGNTAVSDGGGVYASDTVKVQNSTISENTAEDGGGMHAATAEIISSTVTSNTAANNGGGVYAMKSAPTIKGNIIAGNAGRGDVYIEDESSAWTDAGPSEDNSYNIIGYSPGYEEKDIFGAAGPVLANNGGLTKTILLSPGSPAVDAIPENVYNGWGMSESDRKDQRGIIRPNGEKADIGAVEISQPTSFTFSPNLSHMKVGDTAALSVENIQPDGSDKANPVWSSSDEDIVLVEEESGKLTAKGAGIATITAKIWNREQDITINVQPSVTGVAVTPSNVEVEMGKTQKFTASVTVAGSSDQTVEWTVNSTLSSIDADGLLTVGVNETAQTLTVTATSALDSSQSGTATVKVKAPSHDLIDGPEAGKPIDTSKNAVFVFAGEYANVKAIRINGHTLTLTSTGSTQANLSGYPGYAPVLGDVKAGSVVVTLYKEFLQTLSNSAYTLDVEFLDGNVTGTGTTSFEIRQEPQPTPTVEPTKPTPTNSTGISGVNGGSTKTGDNSAPVWIWLVILAAATVSLVFLGKKRLKKQ